MKNRYSPLREARGGRGERSETQGDAPTRSFRLVLCHSERSEESPVLIT